MNRLTEDELKDAERLVKIAPANRAIYHAKHVKPFLDEIRALQKSLQEEYSINGMGGNRELKLMTELEKVRNERDQLKEHNIRLQKVVEVARPLWLSCAVLGKPEKEELVKDLADALIRLDEI